jgi:DnaJ family protein C protein 11
MQVLSSPERRQVYDIYGREGLQAGLQVGPVLQQRSTEELRQDWERFKAQQVRCVAWHACMQGMHTGGLA